jgi:hypothetical protein
LVDAVLGPVVQVLRPVVLHTAHQPPVGHPVADQLVGDQHPRHEPQTPEQLTEEAGGGLRVTPEGDQNVQNIPVLVDRPPQVVDLSTDLDEHLVQVPFIAWA